MNFNATTEYALRLMSYMSLDHNRLYTTTELFEKLNIPFRYLRKQLLFLQKKGLLLSVQGKQGGYRIARNLNEVSLMDIINATDPIEIENKCFFGFHSCPLTNTCSMHNRWGEIRDKTIEMLTKTTLDDLRAENNPLLISLK